MQLKQEIFILFCLLLGTDCIIGFKSVLLLRKLSAKCNMIAWKNSLFSRKCIISKNLQNWKWNINVTFLVVCGCSTSKSSKENIVWIISKQIYFENMTRIILGFLVKWQCGSSIMVVKSFERMRHYLWKKYFWPVRLTLELNMKAGLNIITGHRTLSGKKPSYVQQSLLHNGHSCPAWS